VHRGCARAVISTRAVESYRVHGHSACTAIESQSLSSGRLVIVIRVVSSLLSLLKLRVSIIIRSSRHISLIFLSLAPLSLAPLLPPALSCPRELCGRPGDPSPLISSAMDVLGELATDPARLPHSAHSSLSCVHPPTLIPRPPLYGRSKRPYGCSKRAYGRSKRAYGRSKRAYYDVLYASVRVSASLEGFTA
jgi:hypothetical protein